jgi:hypothetical protein
MTGASPVERLELADWRRRVAELYADVRALASVGGSGPLAAHEHWRATREWLYREHPQSPVPAPERRAFRLRTWPYAPELRFEVVLEAPAKPAEPDEGDPAVAVPMSVGDAPDLRLAGIAVVPFGDGPRRLEVLWLRDYAGGLFLPFRDATNVAETYAAGRYLLDTAKGADLGGSLDGSRLVLDFNFAFQPSCAFDARWSCPLAPPANRLERRLDAGERLR